MSGRVRSGSRKEKFGFKIDACDGNVTTRILTIVLVSSSSTSPPRHRPNRRHLDKSVRHAYDLVRSLLQSQETNARLIEDELADGLWAPRAIVRAALQLLADQGLVARSRRVGTVAMASTVLPVNQILSVREWDRSFQMQSYVLDRKVISAPAIVQRRLLLPPLSFVAMMENVLLQDSIPLVLKTSYVALGSDPEFELNGCDDPVELLEDRLNICLGDTKTIVAATYSDSETANLLAIPEGAPILWLEDLLLDTLGRPCALSQLRYRGDRTVFSTTACRPGIPREDSDF